MLMLRPTHQACLLLPLVLVRLGVMPVQETPRTDRPSHREAFTEVAARTGLKHRHFNGMTGKFYLPEIVGSGAALLDFDNDGDLDIYLVQGAAIGPAATNAAGPRPGDRLFRNELIGPSSPDGKLRFTDVTEASGISATGYGMGVAAGDVNDDGWTDLYVTNLGPNQLLLNNGDGTFRDTTEQSGADDPRWSTSAAFLDYDRDGRLDLFVTNYVNFKVSSHRTCYAKSSALDYCGPDAYDPTPDRLFRNKGGGAFEEVTSAAGVHKAFGAGLGVVTADFNQDGWIDIYVANDGDANQLWINQKDGSFVDEALLAGVALNRMGQAEAGMGVDAGDFDGDGDIDLFMTHLGDETNTLYVNQGGGFFEDRTIETALHTPSLPFTGFGTGWFDYDNDGWLDLLALNGAVAVVEDLARKGDPYPLHQTNQLFRNIGGKSFRETTEAGGAVFRLSEVSRGAAFGDIDNDGDADVLLTNNSGPVRLLVNNLNGAKHWIGLRLFGGGPKRDVIGTRVEVLRPGAPPLWRRVRTDGSYCSSNDPRVLVGLGSVDGPVGVRVHWPWGVSEEWAPMAVDRYWTLRAGESEGNEADSGQ